MKKLLRIALVVVLTATLVFSGYKVFSVLTEYRQAEDLYASVQQDYVEKVVTTTTATGEQKEDNTSSAPIRVDFAGLLSQCEDVVGWLYCPDTVMNYPVVQAEDNETYLHADLSGEYLRSGTLFLDCDNQKPMLDKNHIVYGHSMKNGSMFGVLLKYKKQSFFEEHPVWYYLTPDGDYRVELIAGMVAKTYQDIFTTTLSGKAMMREMEIISKYSTFQSDVTYTEEDAFITLSTCSYEFSDARYVVVGKLVPIS